MSDNKENLTPYQEEPEVVVETEIDDKKDKKKAKAVKEKKVTGRENFSRTRAIIGVVLIIAAVVLAIILVPIISGRETSYSVLYAKQDIAPGVRITQENINTYFDAHQTTDKSLFDSGIPSAQALEVLEGVYTKRDIHEGALVTVKDFTKTSLSYNDRVPEGKVLIAIDIPSLAGNVAYMPKAGDIIRIYRMVSRSESDTYYAAANLHVRTGGNSYAEAYSYLQYVQVFRAVDGNLADSDETGALEIAFVLAVNDGEQARQLVEAAYSGNYYFALVSSGDKDRAQMFLDYQDRVIFEENAGREKYDFNLADLTFAKDAHPKANDILRFSAAVKDESGKTNYQAPDILKYVDVVDLYDKDGKSLAFHDKADLTPEFYEELMKTGKITLLLSEEQNEELKKLIEEAQVFANLVEEEHDSLVYGFETVDNAIWAARAKAMVRNMTLPATELPENQK